MNQWRTEGGLNFARPPLEEILVFLFQRIKYNNCKISNFRTQQQFNAFWSTFEIIRDNKMVFSHGDILLYEKVFKLVLNLVKINKKGNYLNTY